MGVDIYLQSIWKPFEEKLSRSPVAPETHNAAEVITARNAFYDELRASGGYFRNGYNSGDVMRSMGMSWRNDVGHMLDDEGYLPVARARELVEKIEAHPLTRERVAMHVLKNFTSGVEAHPLTANLHALIPAVEAASGRTEPKAPPDLDGLFQFLNNRRDELLAILRKSIELDEPLLCSL